MTIMRTARPGRGGAPAMWGRAERQAGEGASVLFAHLEGESRAEVERIAVLEHLIWRLRAGEWSDGLADLIARARALNEAAGRVAAS